MQAIGIFFALLAMFGWGFDDFYIQQVVRRMGAIKTLFFIGLAGAIGFLPFVWSDILDLREQPRLVLLLLLTAGVTLIASLCNFEALKRGKISIIEPLTGLELPLVVGLGIVLLNESMVVGQLAAIVLVFAGIVLVVTKHRLQLRYHRRRWEHGVIFGGLGALGMGMTVFLVGLASQQTSALLVVWVSHVVLAGMCSLWIWYAGQWRQLAIDWRRRRGSLLRIMALDNIAWVSFGIATQHLPISLATTLSESYIVVAVLLGVVVSKERLKRHQVVGVVCAIAGIVLLSFLIQTVET